MDQKNGRQIVTARAADNGKISQKLPLLVLTTLGVVFGDIGTSPLYAIRESLLAQDLELISETVLGVLSLIFWSLLIVISIKYL
ncbi:MAG: KUP/HAK/KT family potassium transporter, partial [Acidimicrobiia bacterium]